MMTKSFTAQLKDIEQRVLADMRYIAAESIQDVVEAAQTPVRGVTKGGTFEEGKIPVAEAELINSLATDGGAPSSDSYTVAIAGFEIGDSMEFAWTAPHALPVEVGTKDMPGRHFVGTNARRFSEFVENRVAEVRK